MNLASFSERKPTLKSYQFPKQMLPDIYLNSCLKEDRILSIKNALLDCEHASTSESPIQIHYFAPLHNSEIVEEESVDVIFSQAVLEYIEDLERVYRALYRWLKPGGWMSHQIDFRCHGLASEWNGHWAYSDFTWKIIKGKRPYVINREPHSVHLILQKEIGFKIIADLRVKEKTGLERKQLAKKFRAISDEDLTISTAHVVSIKEK
jgi:SAM-dependent methyltransferase